MAMVVHSSTPQQRKADLFKVVCTTAMKTKVRKASEKEDTTKTQKEDDTPKCLPLWTR